MDEKEEEKGEAILDNDSREVSLKGDKEFEKIVKPIIVGNNKNKNKEV